MKYVVAVGNVFHGIEIHGPFDSASDADHYAADCGEGSWPAELIDPDEESDARPMERERVEIPITQFDGKGGV